MGCAQRSLVLAALLTPVLSTGCYTANVSQWTWCSGYDKVGYTCDGEFCSAATCVSSCTNCADFYPTAFLDKSTARCCASLSPGGACAGALPGDAPYNPPYGFPNNGPGALIVEGPVPYNNGPPCWSNATQLGAYGFTMLAQSGKRDNECPAPVGGAWAPPRGLRPIALPAHGEKINLCVLACNLTDVARTGVDPCNAASIFDGGAVDKSLRDVYANYSCYYGGESWLHPPDVGVCGFNCSARKADGATCDDADIKADICELYCDSRTLPGPSRAGSGGVPARRGGAVARLRS